MQYQPAYKVRYPSVFSVDVVGFGFEFHCELFADCSKFRSNFMCHVSCQVWLIWAEIGGEAGKHFEQIGKGG